MKTSDTLILAGIAGGAFLIWKSGAFATLTAANNAVASGANIVGTVDKDGSSIFDSATGTITNGINGVKNFPSYVAADISVATKDIVALPGNIGHSIWSLFH